MEKINTMTPQEFRQAEELQCEQMRRQEQERFSQFEADMKKKMPSRVARSAAEGVGIAKKYGAAIGMAFVAFATVVVLNSIFGLWDSENPLNAVGMICLIVAPFIAFFWMKNRVAKGYVNSADTKEQEILRSIAEEREKMQKRIYTFVQASKARISDYELRYRAEQEQKTAEIQRRTEEGLISTLATSSALENLAGQLSLQFVQAINSADRNPYISKVEVKMEISFTTRFLSYVIFQEGSILHADSTKRKQENRVDYTQVGVYKDISELNDKNEAIQRAARDALAQVLTSQIQLHVMGQFASTENPGNVDVWNHGSEIEQINFWLTFTQDNPNAGT